MLNSDNFFTTSSLYAMLNSDNFFTTSSFAPKSYGHNVNPTTHMVVNK